MSRDHHEIIICGDFNLDVLKCNSNNSVNDYINTLYSQGILQVVTKPTRFTSNSATCLDHFLVNPGLELFETMILTTIISDHFPVFYLGPKTNPKKSKKEQEITFRDFSDQNIQNFSEIYSNLNWQSVIAQNNPNDALDEFLNIFLPTFDNYFAPRTVKFNKNIHRIEPWVTNGILISRRTKISLQQDYFKKSNDKNKSKFKIYRNLYNRIIKLAKRNHYHEQFKQNATNIKKHGLY